VAESKESFALAAHKYQTLVDDGIVNEQLYFNLGSAYLQSGKLGRAIASYERAMAVNPSSTARDSLAHVRGLLKSKQTVTHEEQSQRLCESLLDWN
jgi:tetratricopeptide (TPR) repeat protein